MESITFGTYPQQNETERRPIEWIVLGIRENKALCIARYGLVTAAYCDPAGARTNLRNVEWEYSCARKWCNHEFLENAFSEHERQILSPKGIDAAGFGCGYLCQDKVFLLTEKGVRKYLQDFEERMATPTPNARYKGASTQVVNGRECASWWILPEYVRGDVVTLESGEQYRGIIYPKAVGPDGQVQYNSLNIDHSDYMIRPCILVDLAKAHECGYIQFDKLSKQEFEYYKLGVGVVIRLNRSKEQLCRLDGRHNVWIEDPGLYEEFIHGNYPAKRIGFDDIFGSSR